MQAEHGLRTLGVAKTEEGILGWKLIGIIPLFDPPRKDTANTIERALDYGVDVKMITGDQRAIAIETARRLGMGTNIIGNESLMEDSHVVEQAGGLGEFIMSVNGFAGVYPEHKFKIVESLQNMKKLIGMTGDGVNDAPALKKANVGIAVAGATDAAKSAADIVLLKPGLSTIINALFISRTIFSRLQHYIMYRMASSFLILLFYFFSVIIAKSSMPTWTLILLSIINDFTIMSTSRDNVIASTSPEKWDMDKIICIAVAIGSFCVGECFLFLMLARPESNSGFWLAFGIRDLDTEEMNAALYLLLAIAIQLNIFASRTSKLFFLFDNKAARPPSMILVIPVFGSLILSTFIAVLWDSTWRLGGGAGMAGIDWSHAGVIWFYAVIWFFAVDLVKLLAYKLFYSSSNIDVLFNPLETEEKHKQKTDVMKELARLRKEAQELALNVRRQQIEFSRRQVSSGSIITKGLSLENMKNTQPDIYHPLPHSHTRLSAIYSHIEKLHRLELQLQEMSKQLQILLEWKDDQINKSSVQRTQ